jgi:hypothetical protein
MGGFCNFNLCYDGNGHPGWKGEIKMNDTRNPARRTVLIAILVVIGSGLLLAVAAKLIPRMMSKMMDGMMQNMMGKMRGKMKESGLTPAEMCEKMMKGDGGDQPTEV